MNTVSKSIYRLACTEYLALRRWDVPGYYDTVWKTIGAFDRQLWSACLDYFRGDGNAFDFVDRFASSIKEQLTRAWNEGARNVGVDPADMTAEDQAELSGIINSELDHVLDLAQDIEDAITDKMTLEDFRSQFRARIDLWVNRYNETVNRAEMYFGGKVRLVWRMGATEEHCETCARLNGIVAYAQEWEQSGIRPQSPPNDLLECGGWRCDCSLETTDQRRSPDALTTLMDIAASRNV